MRQGAHASRYWREAAPGPARPHHLRRESLTLSPPAPEEFLRLSRGVAWGQRVGPGGGERGAGIFSEYIQHVHKTQKYCWCGKILTQKGATTYSLALKTHVRRERPPPGDALSLGSSTTVHRAACTACLHPAFVSDAWPPLAPRHLAAPPGGRPPPQLPCHGRRRGASAPGRGSGTLRQSLQGGSGISVYAHPARVRVARSGDGANSESTLPRIAVRSRAASGCAAGGADLTAEVPAQRPSWRRKSELYVCTASLRDTTGFAAANLREGVESGARSSAGRCRGLSPLEKRLWVRQQRFHLPG